MSLMQRLLAGLGALGWLAGCSVDKLAPTLVVHHGQSPAKPRRVVVLSSECSQAWCRGVDALVAAQLAFQGIDVVDPSRLSALQRTRTVVEISSRTSRGRFQSLSQQTTVTVVGPRLSDVDVWTERAELRALGVDAVVRVRTAKLVTWPVRALAMVRITRLADASLVVASACEAELSRLDADAEMMDRAMRCALKGISR